MERVDSDDGWVRAFLGRRHGLRVPGFELIPSMRAVAELICPHEAVEMVLVTQVVVVGSEKRSSAMIVYKRPKRQGNLKRWIVSFDHRWS
jgi:hypothetical protein